MRLCVSAAKKPKADQYNKESEYMPKESEQLLHEQKNTNNTLKKQIERLRYRVRELNCLYSVSRLFERRYVSLEHTLQKIVMLMPRACPYPKKASARIILKEKEYRSRNFSEFPLKQSASVIVNGREIGKVEVFFSEPATEQPETRLINLIAEHIGRVSDERETEDLLKKYQDSLELQLIDANDELKHEIETRRHAEKALRESEEKHRIVLEAAPDPVAVYDTEGKIVFLNPAFTRVFGWTPEESMGRYIDFIPNEQLPETDMILNHISRCRPFSGIETYRLSKEGHKVDVSVSGAFFYDTRGNHVGNILTLQDISERKRAEEELTFIAYHDVLTGLPNRKSFYKTLEEKLNYARNRSGDQKWALLFLDLDRFKYVNDTLGHDAGDELLKVVAGRIRKCLRKSDYVFRLGGDEFTVILNDIYKELDIAGVISKIQTGIAAPCRIKENELYMSATIGISIYPQDGSTVELLVKNADMAMYAAKEDDEGYRFFTEEMNIRAMERMKLGNGLRDALQRNQFILYYQPLVDAMSRITGVEALLRWRHPKMGMVNPEKFIYLAEETGIIVPIGEWVLRSACQQGRKWHDMGYKELYISVNLSTRQFKEKDLIRSIEQILRETGMNPHCLKLEVTESGIMENPEEAIAKMNLLRLKGVRFSIDDFGTGYSSLSYMKRLPIDTLKIDRSFVTDSVNNRDDREIIKTIISMARNLSIETVAEGVENKDQRDFLEMQGCRTMQGYYFGRPMPAGELEDILKKGDPVL